MKHVGVGKVPFSWSNGLGLRLVLSFGLAAAATGAWGADVVWQDVGGDYSGLFTDVAHWSAGRLPAFGDNLYTTDKGGVTSVITFPEGMVSNAANWILRSGGNTTVTLDGRGSIFCQPAIEGNYEQWSSAKFNNVINLERNAGGEQFKKAGLKFTDFVCVLSNAHHAVLKQGTFDFSLSGGRSTLFTSGNNGFSSFRIEKGAEYVGPNSFDYRSYVAHALVDVAGGKFSAGNLSHPTGEGYLVSKTARLYSDFDVRSGGTATFAGSWGVGNSHTYSTNRVFSLTVRDDGSALSIAKDITHTYGEFNLNMLGGTLTAGSIYLASSSDAAGYTGTNYTCLAGGTLTCTRMTAKSIGSAYLVGNGGTMKTTGEVDNYLQGFKAAELGAAGLTLDVGHNVTVAQSFTDLAGESGKLVKTGAGTLTYTGTDSTFGSFEVRDGKLDVSESARLRTALTVKGGTRVTLGADNGLTGLTLGDAAYSGTLTLTVGKPIAVNGPVSFPNAILELSGSMTVGTTNVLLTAKGDCEAAKAVWESYVFMVGTEAGKAYLPLATTDEATGVTSFKVAVSDATYVTRHVTETETAESLVDLGSYGTYDVTVDAEKVYTLAGGLLAGHLLKAGEGAISVPLTLFDLWTEIVLSNGVLDLTGEQGKVLGAKLTVNRIGGTTVVRTEADTVVKSMKVVSGGWIKHGAGTLTIENDGSATQTLTATNGCVRTDGTPGGTVVRIGTQHAPPTTSWTGLSIAEGTVCLKGTKPGARFDLRHSIAVGMPTPDATATPKLVVDNCEAFTGNNSYHFLIVPNLWKTNWEQYGGRDGEVEVLNGGKLRVDTLCLGDGITSGIPSARPKLTVDGSVFLSSFKLQFHRADVSGYRPKIVARNGARLLAAWSNPAERSSAGIEMFGSTDLLVDGSLFAKASGYTGNPSGLTVYYSGAGNATTNIFQNGAELWFMQVATGGDLKQALLVFDDATWRYDGGTNLCVEAMNDGALQLLVKEGGLRFNASNDVRVQHKFEGTGVLRKTGAGKVWFDTAARYTSSGSVARTNPVTLDCDVEVAEGEIAVSPNAANGTNRVTLAAGTAVDLRGAAVNRLVLAGKGTVRNGTLEAPILCASADDADSAVTLGADVTLSGRVQIDLGNALAAPYPQGVVVARYAGEAPNLTTWRLYNRPGATKLRGAFTAENGEVRVNVYRSGAVVILR